MILVLLLMISLTKETVNGHVTATERENGEKVFQGWQSPCVTWFMCHLSFDEG